MTSRKPPFNKAATMKLPPKASSNAGLQPENFNATMSKPIPLLEKDEEWSDTEAEIDRLRRIKVERERQKKNNEHLLDLDIFDKQKKLKARDGKNKLPFDYSIDNSKTAGFNASKLPNNLISMQFKVTENEEKRPFQLEEKKIKKEEKLPTKKAYSADKSTKLPVINSPQGRNYIPAQAQRKELGVLDQQQVSQEELMFDNFRLSEGVRLLDKGGVPKTTSLQNIPGDDITYSANKDVVDINSKFRLSKNEYKNFIEKHGNYSRPGVAQGNILRANSLNTHYKDESPAIEARQINVKVQETSGDQNYRAKPQAPLKIASENLSSQAGTTSKGYGKGVKHEKNVEKIYEEDIDGVDVSNEATMRERDPDESIQGVLNSLNGVKPPRPKKENTSKINVKSPEMLRAMLFD